MVVAFTGPVLIKCTEDTGGAGTKHAIACGQLLQVTPMAESTCWSVIEAASAGTTDSREELARRYGPVVRAAMASRWRSSACLQELDDAVQEVFVECFKQGGILDRVERGRRASVLQVSPQRLRNDCTSVRLKACNDGHRQPSIGDHDRIYVTLAEWVVCELATTDSRLNDSSQPN